MAHNIFLGNTKQNDLIHGKLLGRATSGESSKTNSKMLKNTRM